MVDSNTFYGLTIQTNNVLHKRQNTIKTLPVYRYFFSFSSSLADVSSVWRFWTSRNILIFSASSIQLRDNLPIKSLRRPGFSSVICIFNFHELYWSWTVFKHSALIKWYIYQCMHIHHSIILVILLVIRHTSLVCLITKLSLYDLYFVSKTSLYILVFKLNGK